MGLTGPAVLREVDITSCAMEEQQDSDRETERELHVEKKWVGDGECIKESVKKISDLEPVIEDNVLPPC